MAACLNCQNNFEGSFCNDCGQKASTKRLAVKQILHDLPHSVFHVDKGIFKNLAGIRHPQQTILEYVQGKRVSYYNPLLLFLLSVGVLLLIQHYLNPELHFELNAEIEGIPVNATEFLSQNMKHVCFAAAFLFALPATWLFRKESGFNYAEQVIAQVFILTWANCIYLLLLIVAPDEFAGYPFNLAFHLIVFTLSYLVFFKGNHFITFFKTLAALFIYIALFIFTTILIGVINALFVSNPS